MRKYVLTKISRYGYRKANNLKEGSMGAFNWADSISCFWYFYFYRGIPVCPADKSA